MLSRDPDPGFLFIIGAMKSGTTSLAGVLRAHPDILMGRHKEPNFFADKGSKFDCFEDYRASFRKPFLKRLLGRRPRYLLDASTAYSKYPTFGDSAAAIAARVPDARHIYLMRDPVDRIESQIAHQVAHQPGVAERFAAESDSLSFYKYALRVSSYATQLERYDAAWCDGRVLLLRFDDLKADEAATFTRIWDFLGLEAPSGAISLPHRNVRHSHVDAVKKVRLDPEIRHQLHEALAPEMVTLSSKYGVPVAAWGF